MSDLAFGLMWFAVFTLALIGWLGVAVVSLSGTVRRLNARLTTSELVQIEQAGQLTEAAGLIDLLYDSQDRIEKDLYGDTEGLQESFRELEDEGDALTDRLSKVEQRLRAAGWTVTDDPADLFKTQHKPFEITCARVAVDQFGNPSTHLFSDAPKREERCIAGQCNPSNCDREQCPHRTQEFVLTPYSGLLDNFAAEWDQVLSQGQVELPVQVLEKTVTPIWNGDAELVAIRYTQTEGVSPTTQPPTKGSK